MRLVEFISVLNEEVAMNQMKGAAFQHVSSGKIYGPYPIHAFGYDEVANDLNISVDEYWEYVNSGDVVEGFIDDSNKFYNREEAAKAVRMPAGGFDDDEVKVGNRDWLDSSDVERGHNEIQEDAPEGTQNNNHDNETEQDVKHEEDREKTGYWGNKGAGVMILAKDTGRILLPFRSKDVDQPHTWGGTWGGAIDAKEDPKKAAMRELEEESGYDGEAEIIPLHVYKDDDFRYYNFLAVVPTEFEPKLNWETEKAEWFEFDDWPKPMHFGLEGILDSNESVAIIKKYIS